MKKVAVVFWSGTGNTEAMAQAVGEGVKKGGAEASVMSVDQASKDILDAYDGFLFGCSAMGAEVLEEEEFEPFFASIEAGLSGRKVGLFGSYGWGGGAWMRDWEERVKGDGADLIADGVIAENAPDDAALAASTALGEAMAKAVG